jgi:hypothetical protein
MRRTILIGLALAVVAWLAYANSLNVPFQFDDLPAIVENPAITSPANFAEIAALQPTRLVVFYTFALNHAWGGLEVRGYHLVNLAVHILAALCLFRLVILLFDTPRMRERVIAGESSPSAGHTPVLAATFAAGLFLLHPIQTQAVTYVWQRATSLVGCLYLLGLCLYLESRRADEQGRTGRRRMLIGSLTLVSLLAAFTKENSITLPVAALLLEWIGFGGPAGRVRRWLGQYAPFLATALVVPAVTAFWGNLQ